MSMTCASGFSALAAQPHLRRVLRETQSIVPANRIGEIDERAALAPAAIVDGHRHQPALRIASACSPRLRRGLARVGRDDHRARRCWLAEKPGGRNTLAYDLTPSLKKVTSRFAGGFGADPMTPPAMLSAIGDTRTAYRGHCRNQSAARFDPTSKPAYEYAWK